MARRKRVIEEEHENHERWLISYADLITVLMAMFIVLFAMSQVDDTKYSELKQSLRSGFGQSGAMMHDQNSILDGQGSTAVAAIVPDNGMNSLTPEQAKLVDDAVTRKEVLAQKRRAAEAKDEADRFEGVLKRLRAALQAHGLEDDVVASIDDRGLVVSMISRHVIFNANLASLTTRGQAVIDTLTPVLKDLPDPLQIDGHTNQAKGKPKFYASDWDLSAARAITVLRRLNERGDIPTGRLAATSFGMERPLIDPAKPGSQRVNKRVDIVVLTSLPPESRELLAEYAFNASEPAGETS